MAVMGFHTIDNVHIDLDLILICQCSSEVKKLAQIAPVWSERLGAHPPHVFAALHWMTVSPTELQQLHLVMENHTACWGWHPKANAWQHKTLLSSCDISPRTKTVAENLRCSESCYHRGVIFEPDRDDLISIGFYLPWYRLGLQVEILHLSDSAHWTVIVLGTTQDSSDPQKCALLWQTTKYIGSISANWLVSQMFQDNTWYISCCLGWMMKSREGFEVINSHV